MNNPPPRRWGCGATIGAIALVLFGWVFYTNVQHEPLEIMVNCRMRCAYNYPGSAKLVKHSYANGIVFYQCEEQ